MLNLLAEEFIVVKQFKPTTDDRVIEVGEVWQNTGYAMMNTVSSLVLKLMREIDGKREWLYVSLLDLDDKFEEYFN